MSTEILTPVRVGAITLFSRLRLPLWSNAQNFVKIGGAMSGYKRNLTVEPIVPPKAIQGEDTVVYVEAGYSTEEETFVVGDHMAAIGADIVEETGVLVALAPFVAGE
jgi:hypothetical protein